MRRCLLNAVLLLAAATSGFILPKGLPVRPEGDENVGYRVDVRDVQRVIAAVLGRGPLADGDVNGDGRADILDYQYVLKQVNKPYSGPSPCRRSAPPANAETPVRVLPVMTPADAAAPSPRAHIAANLFESCSGCTAPFGCSKRAERYLSRLTSNAPPLAG